jgi:hypothetical protein
MKLRLASISLVLVVTAVLAAWRGTPDQQPPVLHVVKSPTCGCCQAWIDYMKKEGFTVTVENRDNFTPLKRSNGVTAELESCHTGFVGGYVIEGHVPADLVQKLLKEKPTGVKGLATPGMPMGSPGMEGSRKDAYTVYSFDAQGHARPYANR